MRQPPLSADDVLGFWFGPGADPETPEAPRFSEACEQAAAGAFDAWKDEPRSALALLVLLDALPRRLSRPAGPQARQVARHALARGLDVPLPKAWRSVFYQPFAHSPDAHEQRLGASLLEGNG